MKELEPVGQHRIFVPEAGDVIFICAECGRQSGMVGGNVPPDDLASLLAENSACCKAERVKRVV